MALSSPSCCGNVGFKDDREETPARASWEWRGDVSSERRVDLSSFLASTWCPQKRPSSKNVLRDRNDESEHVGLRHRRADRVVVYDDDDADADADDQGDEENWGWFDAAEPPELGEASAPPSTPPPLAADGRATQSLERFRRDFSSDEELILE